MLSFASLGARARGTAQAPAQQENAAAKSRDTLLAHVTQLYQSAVAAMAAGSSLEARETFEEVLESEALADEENAHANRLRLLCRKSLAALEEERGEVSRAMAQCVEALRLDPGDVALAYRLAELALHKAGDVKTARRALEAALKVDPHFWPALTMLMEMLYALKDDLGCLDAALRCLEAQPYCVRALELRADILFRHGRVSLASRGWAEVPASPRPLVEVPRRAQVPGKSVQPVELKISSLTWDGVAQKVSAGVKKCFRAPLRLHWSEATEFVHGEDDNSKSCSQPPGTPTRLSAPAATKPMVRSDALQQQQQDLLAVLQGFLPSGNAAHETADSQNPDEGTTGGGGRLREGAAAREEAQSVQRWLSNPEHCGLWSGADLLDAVCTQIFLCVTEPWDTKLQNAAKAMAAQALSWDMPGKSYFLGLAELWADSSAALAAPLPGAKKARLLLERFVFAFASSTMAREVSGTVVRLERLKGALCKLFGRQAESTVHFGAVTEMLASLGVREIALLHSRVTIGPEMIQRELSALDQAKQGEQGLALFKSRDFVKVAETLAPLLLTDARRISLDAKRKSRLFEKLYQSVKNLMEAEEPKYVAMFPEVAVAVLSELCNNINPDLILASISSQIRGVLADVARSHRESWSEAQQRAAQQHINRLIVFCRGNRNASGVLTSAWEALFFFLPRPLSQDAVSLLERALVSIVEVEACRLTGGSLPRLVAGEIAAALSRFPDCDEATLEQWQRALHQALQCLFDVRMPLARKGHMCKKAGEMTQASLAGVVALVGVVHLREHDFSGLARKIYQKFAELPQELQERVAAISRLLDDMRDDRPAFLSSEEANDEEEGAVALKLPPSLDEDVAAKTLHLEVYKCIYSIQAEHTVKYCKPPNNVVRLASRSNAIRKWFESKAPEEVRRLLINDLAVVPDRFESWSLLGLLCHAVAEHRLCVEPMYLNEMRPESRVRIAELRGATVRCVERSLLCATGDDMRRHRALLLSVLALQLRAASRMADAANEQRRLLEAGAMLVQRAKEVDPTAWLPWFMSGLLRRRLRADPELYLGDFARALKEQKFKEKGAMFMLHKLRLKLVLENECSLDLLEAFSHHAAYSPEASEAERRAAIAQDCVYGLEAAGAEEDKHHITYLKARIAELRDPDQALENVEELFGVFFGPEPAVPKLGTRLGGGAAAVASAGTAVVSATTPVVAVHVRELEGFGLPECQVADRITRKILDLYLTSLEHTRSVSLLALLLQRLMRWCSAMIEDGFASRAYVPQLRRCARVLLDIVSMNVEIRLSGEDLKSEIVSAAYDLRTAYGSKHAAVLFEEPLDLTEMLVAAAPREIEARCGTAEEVLEELLAMFERRAPAGAAASQAESPNYSALRKKARVAAPEDAIDVDALEES